MLDRVGQVELALRVVRVEPGERVPQRRGLEDVDRRVQLADRALLLGRVLVLDDRLHRLVGPADDAPVGERGVGLEREERHRRLPAIMLLDERGQVLGGEQGRRRIEHEHTAFEAVECAAR